MFVTRYNPNRNMRDISRSYDFLNSMIDEYVHKNKPQTFTSHFTPAINTREGEYAYHLEVDLPGITKEDISISLEENKLVISGERKLKEEVKEDNYYKIESHYGIFSRSFALPESVDIENIHAQSNYGVLEILIPKIKKDSKDKAKKITIN